MILGQLQANGRVWLINPNGILFGAGSVVNVGGLLASTLRITDNDFLSGKYAFQQDPAKALATIINKGNITVSEHGYVLLTAPGVANDGVIVAKVGTVLLGSGQKFNVDFMGDGLITYVLDGPILQQVVNTEGIPLTSAVSNRGTIQADGGQVILTAKAAGDVFASVVNSSGLIRATSLVERNGTILLDGGDSGIVSVSGTLDASGQEPGQTGGAVQMLGEKVGLFAGASINVSGDAGGGTALIGGDFQGKNPAIANAQFTYVDKNATITADALTNGNGGRVIVWSDHTTRFAGAISAKGGSQSGDGGFVEVSGKTNLGFTGTAVTSAPHGKTGSLLLDPDDLYVGVNPNNGATQDAADPFTATGGADFYVLASSLTADSNYTLQASHNVIFNANVPFGSATGKTVSVTATNTIESYAYSVETNGGALTLNAVTLLLGALDTRGGVLTINNSGNALQVLAGRIGGATSLTKLGVGTLTLQAGNSYTGLTTVSAGTLAYGGDNAISTANAVTVSGGTLSLGAFNAGAGTVTVANGGSITGTTGTLSSTSTFEMQDGSVSANLSGSQGLNKTTSGTVTLSGVNSYTGPTTISGGVLSVATIGNGSVVGNLGAANSAAANLVLGGGTLRYTGATASTNRNFTLTAGTTSSIDVTTNNLTMSGASTNTSGALTKLGIGTLTLSGANAHTGVTTISAGTLAYGASNVINTGAVTVSGATAVLALGADQSDSVGTVTVANGGSITGTGTSTLTSTGAFEMQDGSVSAVLDGTNIALNKTTSGTVTLTGANTYTGPTTISGGVLSVATLQDGGTASNIGASSSAAANLVLNGGTLRFTGGFGTTNRLFTLTENGGTIDASGTVALTMDLVGSTAFTGSGPRTLTLTGSNAGNLTAVLGNGTGGATSLIKSGTGTWTLIGANTYSGGTTLNAGTLKAGVASVANTSGAFGNNSAVTLANTAGVTLDSTGFATQIGSLTGGGATGGNVTLGAATLTVGGDNTSPTAYAGVISGTGAMDKIGTGTLTLSGANTYSGLTTVSAGTLNLNTTGANALGGNLTVLGGSAVWQQANQLVDTANVVVSGGAVNVAGFGDTVNGVQLTSGSISGTTGVLTSATVFDLQAGTVSAILGGTAG